MATNTTAPVVTLDDYRRADPMFRVRRAARILRETAKKPGEAEYTDASQAAARNRALEKLMEG